MTFSRMSEREYRKLDEEQLIERLQAIIDELKDPDSEVPTEELEEERDLYLAEKQRRDAASKLEEINVRNENARAVASGKGTPITGAQALSQNATSCRVVRNEDPFDTEDYNRAFANYVMRGEPMPQGLVQPGQHPSYIRDDEYTMVSTGTNDASTFVPTTLMNEIIEKADTYGKIWPLVRKTNVQGGIEYNVADFDAEAYWITEDSPSDAQALTGGDRISFSYYMLEVKLAQSILASVTTLSQFQSKFPEVAMKAIIKKLEQGIINGTGDGQMTGILNDERIEDDNKLAITADDFTWNGWITSVWKNIASEYRGNGRFMMSQATFDQYIYGMVDTNGQPVGMVNYGVDRGEDYRFQGKEVLIVPDDILPSFDDADDGDAVILFGNLNDYLVNSNLNMRVSKWTDEDTNLIKNKVLTIVDGKVLNPYGMYVISKSISA